MGSGSNLLTIPAKHSMTLKDNKQLDMDAKQYILKKSQDEQDFVLDNRSSNSYAKHGTDIGRARNANLGQLKTHQQQRSRVFSQDKDDYDAVVSQLNMQAG